MHFHFTLYRENQIKQTHPSLRDISRIRASIIPMEKTAPLPRKHQKRNQSSLLCFNLSYILPINFLSMAPLPYPAISPRRRRRTRLIIVPGEVCMISQFTRFDEMSDGEEGTEHDTDSTDDDVGDSEEGVLAAHYGAGADYDGFGTAVVGYVEVCLLVRCETEGILGWGWGVWERTVGDVKGISSSNHSLII